MADITITGPVTPTGSLANVGYGITSVAVTAGQAVYETSAGLIALADADASATTAQAVGIAVCTAAIGEVCVYAKSGATITQAGTTFGKNIPLFVSNTAGGLMPVADLSAGEYGCCLGFGLSTTTFKVAITYTGVAT